MLGIRVPDPDEALLISGGRGGRDGAPFRVVVGNRKFVMPFVNRVSYLTLAMQEAQVSERCVTNQGIEIQAKAVCAFKVATDEQSIVNAGQRFLSDQEQMPNLVGQIFAGHLRSIIGSMTVEDIVQNRQALATEVLDASKDDEAQTAAATRQAQLREQELVSERVKPAQADAEATRIKAQAEAEATRMQAEAAASNDRVALERMIIEQLPSLVSNAGTSLARANVTVLNGSDGLSEVAAGLVTQALAIYNEARNGLVANGNESAPPSRAGADSVA